jgi:hypothetical protein
MAPVDARLIAKRSRMGGHRSRSELGRALNFGLSSIGGNGAKSQLQILTPDSSIP